MIYWGILALLAVPLVFKSISFIDIFIIFCLYYDAVSVFAGDSRGLFGYSQIIIVTVFSIYYILMNFGKFDTYTNKLFLIVFSLMAIFLFFPIMKGVGFEASLRIMLYNVSSIMILPLAFHYYSTKGDVHKLLKIGGYFIVIWVLLVGIFTYLKIDASIRSDLGSQGFGLGLVYYGDMSTRGAISYIGLLMLLVPLMLKLNSIGNRMLLVLASIALLAIILVALKRFTLVVLVLGLINYILNTNIKMKQKLSITSGAFVIIIPLLLFTDISSMITQSYYKRGAERKFSTEAIEGDVRLYEPLYILQKSYEGGLADLFIGSQTDRTFDIVSEKHRMMGRQIHNEYGQILLIYGLIGVMVYLTMFGYLYHLALYFKNVVSKFRNVDPGFWITAQNLLVIFVIGGMVGGHVHQTYRSIALIFPAAITGYYYKLIKANSIKIS